jgi:hypothetical protein
LFISQDATLIAKNTDNPTHKHPNTQAREEWTERAGTRASTIKNSSTFFSSSFLIQQLKQAVKNSLYKFAFAHMLSVISPTCTKRNIHNIQAKLLTLSETCTSVMWQFLCWKKVSRKCVHWD